MIGRSVRFWILGIVLIVGGALFATERAQAVQFGTPGGGGLILCQIGTWRVNQCPPPPKPQCEEVLGLTITSVWNGNRLETQTFTGSELVPRHPIAAGARYNSGTGRWEDPNNPNNYVTFAPEIRLSRKTCSGHDPQFGAQEISHNTLPVDPGHSVDIAVTVTCSNCTKQRLTTSIPVDTMASVAPPTPIQPPPVSVKPPVIGKPTPIALGGTAQCTSGQPTLSMTWNGGSGADGITVWRGGLDAGSHGGWERVQTYSGLEAVFTAFADRNVTSGTTYQYQVEATTYAGGQTLSNVIRLTTPTCTSPGSLTLTGQLLCVSSRRVARVEWQAVSGATQYQVVFYEEGVNSDFQLAHSVGPATTSTTVPLTALVGLVKVRVYATTPSGVATSNDFISSRENPCLTTPPSPTPPTGTPPGAALPATIAASGTARFSVSGLPAGATWDRLVFPGLALNGGRVTASIEGRIPPADPNSSGVPSTITLFELTDANASIDLSQVPNLSNVESFSLVLTLSADATQQQTPRIPKIFVTAKPPKPTPAPTVQFSAGVGQDQARLGLTNWGPGSIELASAAPFNITTLAGEVVYTPTAAQQQVTVAAGQTKSWTWDYKNTSGAVVPSGTYVAKLTYRFAGQDRTAEAQIVKPTITDDAAPTVSTPTPPTTAPTPAESTPVTPPPSSPKPAATTPSTPTVPTAVSQGLTKTPGVSIPSPSSPAPTSTKPAQPTKLVGTAQSQTAVVLTWQDNATDEIGYVVERRLTACRIKRIRIERWRFKIERTCPQFAAVTTLRAGTTSYTDSSLTRNTLYEYRVKAKNTTDESDASATVRVRTKR